MKETSIKMRTAWLPLYSEVRQLLQILDGESDSTFTNMQKSIWEQVGTPQNPVNWSDPDTWISDRLSDDEKILAQRIWKESNGKVNPRHISDSYYFFKRYNLLIPNNNGIFRLSIDGKEFLSGNKKILKEIDNIEGIPHIIDILATKTRAKRSDFLSEWGEFCREYWGYGTESTIKDTLRRRLLNLLERGYIIREGKYYIATEEGINYATTFTETLDPKRKIMRSINEFNSEQREILHQRLSTMSPYHFERLILELLEDMGYEDVKVTKESGDKGVDVIATMEYGISTVTEVIQVKRQKGNIGRPVLDQLRGALPYFDAIRGTIIALGNFSKGCIKMAQYQGAAPITLINGRKLLDLLIEHEIGMRKRSIEFHEFDEDFLNELDESKKIEDIILDKETKP